MKKLTNVGPLQKGRIRIIIRYRNGEVVYYEGVYNPDANLKPLQKILSKRPPKPQQGIPVKVDPDRPLSEQAPMSVLENEAASFIGATQ